MHKSLKVNFSNFGKVDNNGHVRGRVQIAYAGKNVNMTEIPRQAFENAVDSLKNIPVVGNWLGSNFGGHDMILEERGNDIVIKDATTPYGVVPEDCNPEWETVEDEHGNTKEYFSCDVILWYERYPEQINFIMENGVNQSMEIMVTDGDFDDDYNYFIINDFYYSALCLLGIDNGDGGEVPPAFEDSKVTAFKLDKKFEAKFEKVKREEFKEAKKNMEFKEKYESLKLEFEELKEESNSNLEELQNEKAELESELEALEETVQELEASLDEYKLAEIKAKKDEIISEYKELLAEEVIAEISAELEELSVEELDFKLAKAVAENVKAKKADFAKEKDNKIMADKVKPKPFDISGKYFV